MTSLTPLAVTLCVLVFMSGFEPYQKVEVAKFVHVNDPRYLVPERYKASFWRYVRETGIPADIACRLVFQESSWNRFATHRNHDGSVDRGLLQLNSKYLPDYAWRYNDGRRVNPLDPETALRVGFRKLAHNYRMTGSWWAAVASYNCGLDAFRAGPSMESILLADRVLGKME